MGDRAEARAPMADFIGVAGAGCKCWGRRFRMNSSLVTGPAAGAEDAFENGQVKTVFHIDRHLNQIM